ncbi:D-aminoacylase [Streptacidiphilus sp. N1-10]|uniref:D-aminoacylase n=1 Tax=Streptacidiphilus jeojiensis TaxID=3229225 RepID=A0ABV6XVY7_9ACTN
MPVFDLLLRGGTVYDGTGAPGRRADIGVRDDRIVAVIPADDTEVSAWAEATEVLDCEGLAVAPGFIDLHSHGDLTVNITPAAEGCLRQGVTTLVTGNCGTSPFPSPFWRDFTTYAEGIQACEPAVNIAAQVGHIALRQSAIGDDRRPATDEEVARMRALLSEAAEQGVFGFSTGLIYAPGSFADAAEITALASEAHAAGLFYSTHMRDEGDQLIEAVQEAISTARASGVSLQISHLKAMGQANYGKVTEALRIIDDARAEGLDVACDVYLYTAASTVLTSRMPDWAMDGGQQALLRRLAEPETRQAIADELRSHTGGTFLPEGIVIATLPEGRYSAWVGKSVQQIADAEGLDAAETVLDLLAEHQANVLIIDHAMAQEDVDAVLLHPTSAVVSDGWALDVNLGGQHHPRNFGAFARALADSRERGLLDLTETVRKMTQLPAARAGMGDRGVIAEGNIADLVVFDPDTVADTATYTEPLSYATGVRHVAVNGRLAIRDGELTGLRLGRVLKRPRA